ncbi:hypothetical protein LO762_08330 [Actinocorallia sp. API 0066]|uniref:hypothetical protein n=1 Tax=Actinocorallia sp. API 0066 TaxID=2896846 RepID=UPI001E34223E|nr:hypothetical protein [Actinocorallia sp. API 0066]MCD0449193.1 hypothetical protein [Actinocorallia sp. API 0066]
MSTAGAPEPVLVGWTGRGDAATRRAVLAAVAAGVRRALGPDGPASLARAAAGRGPDGGGVSWGPDAAGSRWVMPGYDGGGAPVAVPILSAPGAVADGERLPLGDVIVRSDFPAKPVIRLIANTWVMTGDGAHVASPSLARALAWGRVLYRAHGFAVLERLDPHAAERFVMVPLAEPLLSHRFGDGGPATTHPGGDGTPGLRVGQGRVQPLKGLSVVAVATGDGHYAVDLAPRARWGPAALRREVARTPRAERLDPAVTARVAESLLTAEGTGAEPGTADDVMLRHIVAMDRDIFAALPWERRAAFLTVLSGLRWPSARQKRAMVELVASARSGAELEAMAAILRENGAYGRLFTTLDGSVVELLLVLGRTRPRRPMSPRFVGALFRDLSLLPSSGEDAQAPDVLRRTRVAANGLSLWVRSTVDGVIDLFTHPPAELIRGVAHLAEFVLLVRLATGVPPDPAAEAELKLIADQAGAAIRTAMAGLEYAEELGTPYGNRGGGAHVSGDLAGTLATALAVEILSWFVGIGEIKDVLKAAELGERLAALLKVLAAARGLGGTAAKAGKVAQLDRFVAALARVAMLRDLNAAARAARLLPAAHLAELVRLAELLDVPAGAKAKALRELAHAKNVLPEVRRLADALSLARRFERRAAAVGGVTEDMAAALRRLLDTGWARPTLAELVDAVPAERLGAWSRAVVALRPDQVTALGAEALQALAYWPRSLAFVVETGGDVYLTLLRRHGGRQETVDVLLHSLDLWRAELGGPASYQRLLDRLARGEKAAFGELAQRISREAEAARDRLRAAGRRRLLREHEEAVRRAAELRGQGRTTEAAEVLARHDEFAAWLGRLSDRELSGLDHVARLTENAPFRWQEILDLPAAHRAELLVLVDDIASAVPGGRLLSGAASFVERQLVEDLSAHAATGYRDLMYLYHPSVEAELPQLGERMLRLFDTPALTAELAGAGQDPGVAKAAFREWLKAGNLRVYGR